MDGLVILAATLARIKRAKTNASDDEQTPTIVRHKMKQKFSAGRNDRCPCGSGKKFKTCCIGVMIIDEGVK